MGPLWFQFCISNCDNFNYSKKLVEKKSSCSTKRSFKLPHFQIFKFHKSLDLWKAHPCNLPVHVHRKKIGHAGYKIYY